jgi:hypothetical protein
MVREIRSIHATLPILIATGKGPKDVSEIFQGAKHIAFVGKPYRAEDLSGAPRRLKSPFNQRSAADLEASGIKNDGGPRVCHRYLGRDANFLNQAKATGTARIVLSCASVSGKPSRFP